jgi:iron complex outermembrane receptor protein
MEDKFSLSSDTLLVGSIQYHQSKRKKTDSVIPAANYDINYTRWIPRIGVVHNLSPANQIFANISQNFEPPIFDVASVMLASKAQTGTSYEVGARGRAELFDGRGQIDVDVTLYRANLRNEFQTVCNSAPPCASFGQSSTVNVPKTIHQGIEMGLTALLDRQ